VHFDDHFEINETISKEDTVSGTLNDLEPAIKKNLDKYLSIVDIGQFFKKLQVAASPNIDFGEGEISDPISEALIEVSYPNFDNPVGPNGKVSLKTLVEGFHYNPAHIDQAAPVTLASWTRDNPKDIINISFLRLDKNVPDGTAITSRLGRSSSTSPTMPGRPLERTTQFTSESVSNDHAPVIGPEEVGYVFVNSFWIDPSSLPT